MRKSIGLASILVCVGATAALADSGKKLSVTSTDFKNNEAIPSEYTCYGSNKLPELSWSAVPEGTKSVAILVDDTDAPKTPFMHLLVTGIPTSQTSLAEGASMPSGADVVSNDKGTSGYTGPCPTNASTHHYHFRVYALDTTIKNATGRAEFLNAIKGHILAQGELVGTYKKSNEAGSNNMGSGSSR